MKREMRVTGKVRYGDVSIRNSKTGSSNSSPFALDAFYPACLLGLNTRRSTSLVGDKLILVNLNYA